MLDFTDFFSKIGYEKYEMEYAAHGKYTCYKAPDGCFYKIDHFSNCYVIECAENEEEARKCIFFDTDLFDDKLSKEELESKFHNWFTTYANGDE